jgi:hypothetical protein
VQASWSSDFLLDKPSNPNQDDRAQDCDPPGCPTGNQNNDLEDGIAKLA